MNSANNIERITPNSVAEYEYLLEILRTRLNVLNASMFLLEDNLNSADFKTSQYLKKINIELERIRQLIIQVPENIQSEYDAQK